MFYTRVSQVFPFLLRLISFFFAFTKNEFFAFGDLLYEREQASLFMCSWHELTWLRCLVFVFHLSYLVRKAIFDSSMKSFFYFQVEKTLQSIKSIRIFELENVTSDTRIYPNRINQFSLSLDTISRLNRHFDIIRFSFRWLHKIVILLWLGLAFVFASPKSRFPEKSFQEKPTTKTFTLSTSWFASFWLLPLLHISQPQQCFN